MPRIIDSHVPVGSIQSFGANTSAASGWLICQGQLVSRTTYAALFAAIGTTWGAGDGSTTFKLPDMRGKFLRGRDAGAGNDPDAGARTGGDNVGSTQGYATHKRGLVNSSSLVSITSGSTDSQGSHSHGVTDPGHSHAQAAWDGSPNLGMEVTSENHAYDYPGSPSTSTSTTGISIQSAGTHSHNIAGGSGTANAQVISGGDNETRPTNVNVAFYIKF